jgi:hypothetical protein
MISVLVKITVISVGFGFSCFAQVTATIRGQVIGKPSGALYLYAASVLSHAPQLMDSVKLTNPFFSFQKPRSEPAQYFIAMTNAPGQFYFVWDNDVVLSLRVDDLNQSLAESPVNEALKSFSDTVGVLYENRLADIRPLIPQAMEQKDTLKAQQLSVKYYFLSLTYYVRITSFIRTQKDSWAILFMLVTYHKDLGRRLTLDLLAGMPAVFQQSQLGNQLRLTLIDPTYIISP